MARRKTEQHETTIAEVIALIDAQHPQPEFAPDVDGRTDYVACTRQVRAQRAAILADHGYTSLDEFYHQFPWAQR
ncbi:hypothetical protein [Aeromicrobium sp. CTD01-1L150]|uniref:hypothetical protein n=1 Tax=Aeromicrobium sp. CTD01-1L150 TaxID=3341830 RepID=UPI0035C1551D